MIFTIPFKSARRPGGLALGCLLALASVGALAACGDDTDASPGDDGGTTPVTPLPDAGPPGTPDAATPADGGAEAGNDAQAPAGDPVTPVTSTRLVNANNPYGLVWGTDGKLYAAGTTTNGGGERELAVWRFGTDGKLDATFGTAGVISTAIPATAAVFDALALKDGSLVVQVNADGKVWLAKLAKAGEAFTWNAPVPVVFGWADADFAEWPVEGQSPAYSSWSIALDTSNAAAEKVVVFAHGAPAKVAAGGTQRTDNDRWVARVLASDFSADPTFNGGKAYGADADGKGLSDGARRGLVQADGTIVSSGYTNFGAGANNHVVLLRLKPDGTPDTTFGFGTTSPGQARFNPFLSAAANGNSEAYAIARQTSGRYVTTGYGVSAFDTASVQNDLLSFGVVADRVDPSYGRQGAWAIQSENDPTASAFGDNGRDLAILADDRTVQVGGYDGTAAIFVMKKDGGLDTSFGDDGMLRYGYGAQFFRVVRSADGKKLAASTGSVTANGAAPNTATALVVTLKVGQ